MFKVGDRVEKINKDTTPRGLILTAETIKVLKECNFKGHVSQVQDGLVYVGFKATSGWITQVFKPEEIKEA